MCCRRHCGCSRRYAAVALPYLSLTFVAVGGRLESPIGTATNEVIQVALGCLSLPSLAADTELLLDFCRLLTAALSSPVEAALWEPLAQLLIRLLRMFVSALGDQTWVPDQATPADGARLVSGRRCFLTHSLQSPLHRRYCFKS